MKIYTEIIYEWIDGGLKEVSSESFDYKGEVISCKGWSPPALPTVKISTPTINVDTNFDEMLGSGMDKLGENLQMGGSAQDLLQAGGQNLQQGLDQTAGQIGTGILQPLVTEIGAGIDTGLAFVSALGNKLSEFIQVPSSPQAVKLKKQETAGDKKKKRSAELAANKAKSRSRSALKIG